MVRSGNMGNNGLSNSFPQMRKIDQQLINAIKSNDYTFAKGNRLVDRDHYGQMVIRFHGHTIAGFTPSGLWIDNCGYWTNTTKQILNEILLEFCDSWLFQHKFDWFVEGRHNNQKREYTGGKMFVDLV